MARQFRDKQALISVVPKLVPAARRKRMHSHLGFTLIELLVTTLPFAIAAQGLISVVVNSITAINSIDGDTNEDARDRYILRKLMQISDRSTLERGGEIILPSGQSVQWSAEHTTTDVTDLHQVNFTVENVNPSETKQDQTYSLYLLRPWLSDSSDRAALLEDKRAEIEREASFSR